MASILHGLLNATNFRNPFLRTLVPSIGLAYGIQAAVAIPSIFAQTERFYDLSGSFTYISCAALSLYLPTIRARLAALPGTTGPAWPSLLQSLTSKGGVSAWNWRQVVLSAAVTFWAARLGSFLFARITAEDGKDSRFDDIRVKPSKFAVAFFAQATWVSLCLMPVLAINSIPATALAALPFFTITDILGLLLYVGGITFEATADRQKSQWMKEKKEKKHEEDFLTRGLWSKSRHPVSTLPSYHAIASKNSESSESRQGNARTVKVHQLTSASELLRREHALDGNRYHSRRRNAQRRRPGWHGLQRKCDCSSRRSWDGCC